MLLAAGVPQQRIAELTGVSVRTIRRIGREPPGPTPPAKDAAATMRAQEPRLKSLEVLRHLRERGYAGNKFAVSALVRKLRVRPGRPSWRFEGLAGEFGQHDFGEVLVKRTGGGRTRVHFFPSRLKYLRYALVTLVPDQRVETLVRTLAARIAQQSAWFLAHRGHEAWNEDGDPFDSTLEVDETYVGGKPNNIPNSKRKKMTGRGPVGKSAVVGAKNRETKKVTATVFKSTDKDTFPGFVKKNAAPGAAVCIDDAKAYETLRFNHHAVKHPLGEYVEGDAHTNGIESLWSMLKRAQEGTLNKLGPKHRDRYVQEFAGRHNIRDQDTIDLLASVARGMKGKRPTYKALMKDDGLSSGARAA